MIHQTLITPEWEVTYENFKLSDKALYLDHITCHNFTIIRSPYRYACNKCWQSLTKEESKAIEDFVLACDLAEIL